MWPPPQLARALYDWALRARRAVGGRAVRPEAIHLTLAFLGEVPAERLSAALRAAQRVRFARHALPIEEAGCWAHRGIVWAGPRTTPPETAALVERLRLALAAEGFALEPRPFVAHVTLLRKAKRSAELPTLEPLAWTVTEFVLARSRLSAAGASYETLARFSAA